MPKKTDESQKTLKRHESDTGSPEVQIELLTKEIEKLQAHLQAHIHDYDAKRGILKKVARRRSFLKYLKENNLEAYTKVSSSLGLKV